MLYSRLGRLIEFMKDLITIKNEVVERISKLGENYSARRYESVYLSMAISMSVRASGFN